MKLELGCVQINDIQFASGSKIEDGTIYTNAEELKALLLEDENLKPAELEITKPGKSIRTMPAKDVTEPRVKANGGGNLLPDVISKVKTVGSGRANVLKGSTIVATGKITGSQEDIIDICSEGAKYTPSSQLSNPVVVYEPIDGLAKHAHEKAARFAGLKVVDYIGKLTKDVEPDEVEVHETCSARGGTEKYPELPGVAYVPMLQSQSLMHNAYVYRVDMEQSLPTTLNPTELMDDAILSGNCVSACDKNITYHHPNSPTIVDLFGQHGKILNFVGAVIASGNVYLADKMRSSDWTSKPYESLGVDGAIVSQEGFGSPDTDLIMNCKKIEAKGVKTVIITDGHAGRNGTSQSLADADASASAVAIGGNANMVINSPIMDKVIGYPEAADIIAGGFDGSLQKDGSIAAEFQVITGATNGMDFNKLGAR